MGRVMAWLGLPTVRIGRRSGKPAPAQPAGRLRRWGRWLAVRGLASAAFRPVWWGAGLAALGMAAPGPWWLASIAIGVLCLRPALSILTRSDQRSFVILISVSSRVKSLELRRRLRRGWVPVMVRLGLSEQRRHRDQTVTVTPTLTRLALGPYGVEGLSDVSPLGLIVDDLGKRRERLETEFRADCRVTKVGHGLARVRFRHTDPLARPVAVDALPGAKRWLHVTTGLDDDGRAVERGLLLPHLVVGAQGSGKSSEAWTLLYAIQQAGIPCRVRVFDPKGGQEFGELADAAYAYESNPARWSAFLGSAFGALQKRQRELAQLDGGQGRKVTRFTDRQPLDLLLIDELVAVLAMRDEVQIGGASMRADEALRLYLSQARAAGHTVLALSQLGHADVIGRARPLFSYATCLRVGAMESAMVDVVLGKGAHEKYPAHQISPGARYAGHGYTRLEHAVVRYRAAHLTDEQRRLVVERMAAATDRVRAARKASRQTAGASL